MNAQEIRELTEKSKLDTILEAIKESAKKGNNYLNLWDYDDYEHYRFKLYNYTAFELNKLRDLGFVIEEKEDISHVGFFWNKQKVIKLFHTIAWR